MKKFSLRVMSVLLCLTLLFTGGIVGSLAATPTDEGTSVTESFGDKVEKGFYDFVSALAETIVKAICNIYPNPKSWQDISEYDSDEVGFMAGRETYQTSAKLGNYWSLGYGSRSLVPEDITSGKYYIGRDLNNRFAKDVYDDQRIRVAAFDDNSGEGIVVMGAVDALGVTSTDVRTIRKAILEYAESKGIKVASINIFSTHSHSSLDTQGVATEFFKKFAGKFFWNLLGIESELPGLEAATYFKEFFIDKSIEAVKEAIDSMEPGTLSFAEVDTSPLVKDKRGLIAKEDLQDMPVLHFVPTNPAHEGTYIADISSHATTFSASHGYVTGDYIYYADEYIKQNTGDNFVMVAGALGQVSKDFDVDFGELSEYEAIGANTKGTGYTFAKAILDAESWEPLAPVLNAQHKEIFIEPENSILLLACEIELVNNKCYYGGTEVFKKYIMPSELGYIEFGNKVGFALFPGELYPEVFLGNEITGNVTWDGTDWQYGSMADSVDGVHVYAISLANDALGYALTDNNFAFMGHIIGDGIADETLSIGKHIGSLYISKYLELIEEYTK